MTGEVQNPLLGPVNVPGHLQCARALCPSPRTAAGQHRYCSARCKAISDAVWNDVPQSDAPDWGWAP